MARDTKRDITSIIQWLMLLCALSLYLFYDGAVAASEQSLALPFSMLLENTIVVNAASPLALFSVLSAKTAIIRGDTLALSLGYVAALVGNILSYLGGRALARPAQPQSQVPLLAHFGAYWHPQLASIFAFTAGSEGMRFSEFISRTVPISIFWYTVACLILWKLPIDVRESSFALFGVGLIVVWMIWTRLPR